MKKARVSVAAAGRPGKAADRDVKAIVSGTHADAFAVLGPHGPDGQQVARCFIPHADSSRPTRSTAIWSANGAA